MSQLWVNKGYSRWDYQGKEKEDFIVLQNPNTTETAFDMHSWIPSGISVEFQGNSMEVPK